MMNKWSTYEIKQFLIGLKMASNKNYGIAKIEGFKGEDGLIKTWYEQGQRDEMNLRGTQSGY